MKQIPKEISDLAWKLAEKHSTEQEKQDSYYAAFIESFLRFGPPLRAVIGPEIPDGVEYYWNV